MQNICRNCWVHLNSKQQQQQINTVNWSKLKHRKAAKSPLTHKNVSNNSLSCKDLLLSAAQLGKSQSYSFKLALCEPLSRKKIWGERGKKERKKERKDEARKEIRKKRNRGRQGAKSGRVGRQEVNTQSTTSPTVTTTFKLNIKICTQNPVQVHNVSSTCIHKHRALMVFHVTSMDSAQDSLRVIRVRGRLPKLQHERRRSFPRVKVREINVQTGAEIFSSVQMHWETKQTKAALVDSLRLELNSVLKTRLMKLTC